MATDERDRLITQNIGLAWAVALRDRHLLPGMDLEDIGQIALVGLIRAAEAFDPARGVRFSTFATSVVRYALRHERAHQNRHKTRVLSDAASIDARPSDFHPAAATDDRQADDAREKIRLILHRLDDEDRRLLIARFGLGGDEPRLLRELAEPEGLTRQRVQQRIQGALERAACAGAGLER